MISLNTLMLLSIMVLHNNTNDLVHILVQHFTLYSIGNGMVFGVALFSCYFTMFLVKKVIGGPTSVLQWCLSYWAASSGVILHQ